MSFLKKNLSEIDLETIIQKNNTIFGLDIGDKTIGIAIADKRIKIASSLCTIQRKYMKYDCEALLEKVKSYNVSVIIVGWPIMLNGSVGKQCDKIVEFIECFSQYIDLEFIKWDERFSTSVVDNLMIKADISRRRRKQIVDKIAATYILQGAIDFINKQNIN